MFGAVALVLGAPAHATPGPDSVAVLANAGEPSSIALMKDYARRRHIPKSQLCTVDVPPFVDISSHDFRNKIAVPFANCLLQGKALERIEAVVLMRGMPRRMRVDVAAGTLRVSVAGALAVFRAKIGNDSQDIVGKPPGIKAKCGDAACWAAIWQNPYSKGPFEPDWHKVAGPAQWRMWLVTAIDGYTDKDARLLIDAAEAAKKVDLSAQWLLMKGADKARGVLDVQYPAVAQKLAGYVPSPIVTEKFNAELKGRHLMAFVTGAAKLGQTIEGNTFAPGALVDNVTSLGATPTNFNAPEVGGQEAQVSICRWVRKGVTGVHGTVAEPLNNSFPARQFLVDYASGATLAEAYWKNLPFVYWMNIILGDPMVAPFAKRPLVTVESPDGRTAIKGETLEMPSEGSVTLRFKASFGTDKPEYLRVFVDGALAASVTDAEVDVQVQAGKHHIVAVARVAAGDSGGGVWKSKGWGGWFSHQVVKPGGGSSGGADDGTADKPPDDSGCSAGGRQNANNGWFLLIVTALIGLMRLFTAC